MRQIASSLAAARKTLHDGRLQRRAPCTQSGTSQDCTMSKGPHQHGGQKTLIGHLRWLSAYADAPRPVRQAASTLAAAGNAFAVAGRSTERPTASTGTSRPVTRQQAALKKEEGSPGAPEQASGHTGQPSGFRAPLPRSCAPHQAAAANRHNGEDGFPAG